MEMFEKASKLQLRFDTSKGRISTEDLWQLNLESLDAIAREVNKKLKEEGEESFITPKTTKSTHNDLRLEILKYIISCKLKEAEDRRARTERLAQASKLRELIEKKADEKLSAKSIEELQKELTALESLS